MYPFSLIIASAKGVVVNIVSIVNIRIKIKFINYHYYWSVTILLHLALTPAIKILNNILNGCEY